jgi:hypothetical protein
MLRNKAVEAVEKPHGLGNLALLREF